MPHVTPKTPDLYLCHKVKLDENKPVYITEFEAKSTKEIAHHILLFACSDPGPEETWNCGEMNSDAKASGFPKGPVCQSRQNIIFAWALDAPKLVLPEDVAFKLGGDTDNKYLVVQVHYANVDIFKNGGTDDSGIILKGQTEPVSKLAGVYLMATGGRIPAHKKESFETACELNEDVVMHPFAYRTHAHKLAIVNSGYLVENNNGKQKWTEIGRRSPQLPQMFFPVSNEVSVKKGDVLAARCTMFNFRDNMVKIGSTGNDEMCNFYIMYWVNGENLLDNNVCFTNGPPFWHFENFKTSKGIGLDEKMIPGDISEVPEVQKQELEIIEKSGGLHGMHHGTNTDENDHSNMEHHEGMEHKNEMNHHEGMSHHEGMEHHDEIKTNSKNTDKIIALLLKKYDSDNRFRRLGNSDEEDSGEYMRNFEKAYMLKKILNEFDLN